MQNKYISSKAAPQTTPFFPFFAVCISANCSLAEAEDVKKSWLQPRQSLLIRFWDSPASVPSDPIGKPKAETKGAGKNTYKHSCGTICLRFDVKSPTIRSLMCSEGALEAGGMHGFVLGSHLTWAANANHLDRWIIRIKKGGFFQVRPQFTHYLSASNVTNQIGTNM